MNVPSFLIGCVAGGVAMFLFIGYTLGWARREGLFFLPEDLKTYLIIKPGLNKKELNLEDHL